MTPGQGVTPRAWFGIDALELREAKLSGPGGGHGGHWLVRQIEERRDELLAALNKRLLRGIQYRRNRSEIRAIELLGTERRFFSIRLHRRGKFSFFVVE